MESNNIVDKRTKGKWIIGEIFKDQIYLDSIEESYLPLIECNTGTVKIGGGNVTQEEAESNASFICKAVNEYDDLIKFKEEAIKSNEFLCAHDSKLQSEYDKLKEDNKQLLESLKEYVQIENEYHGIMPVFMRPITSTIKRIVHEIRSDQNLKTLLTELDDESNFIGED